MPSLADGIQAALARKKVPPFQAGSTHDLAQQLGMFSPISVQKLLGVLADLPPASVTFDSGPLTAGFVHGSAYLFLQSDGGVAWGGHVHESGAIGDNFRFAVALLDVKDEAGNVLVFVHSDTLAGQLEIGFSDKEWNDFDSNQFVADHWEQIKTTRFEFRLHASTDPFQVIEAVFEIPGAIFVIALAGAGVALAGQKLCPGGTTVCGWSLTGGNGSVTPGDPRQSPGVGAEYICRCES